MGPLLWVIVVVGSVFLVVTAYMEWIGVMSLITPRCASRYPGCGHIRAIPTDAVHDDCWPCRHHRMRHPLQAVHLHHLR
jgi:hypothetical protein